MIDMSYINSQYLNRILNWILNFDWDRCHIMFKYNFKLNFKFLWREVSHIRKEYNIKLNQETENGFWKD